ncbi:UNVERIFIED_CONTAM: hypothetical protein FKN15_028766, partial [Acipenser sinensis]
SEEEDDNSSPDVCKDDLYARKVGVVLLPTANVPYDKYLPKYWTPEEDQHVQKIKLGSQRRPWYRKFQGFSPRTIDHDSNDLELVEPPVSMPRLDAAAGHRIIKCERSSFLSPLNQQDGKAAQEDLLPDLENDMFTCRIGSFHSNVDLTRYETEGRQSAELPPEPDIKIVTQPMSKTLRERSYTVEVDTPYSSQNSEVTRSTPAYHPQKDDATITATTSTSKAAQSNSSVSEAAGSQEQSSVSLCVHNSMDTRPGVARVSASLPRSYQRPDSTRLTSIVAPRPFGTQSNRVSSLPRAVAMDSAHSQYNGDLNSASQKTYSTSRYSQVMKMEDDGPSQSSSVLSSTEEQRTPSPKPAPSAQPGDELTSSHVIESNPDRPSSSAKTQYVTSTSTTTTKLPEAKVTTQKQYNDMRISLNQKSNSGRDFGFIPTWGSAGVFVKSIEPGSPSELCQMQVDDEILTVNGLKVSDMDYSQWKESMDTSVKRGTLVMDIRRYGKNKSEPISLKNLQRRSQFFEQGKKSKSVSSGVGGKCSLYLGSGIVSLGTREEVQHLQEQERARRQHEEEEQERRRQEEEQHQQRLEEEEERRHEEAEAHRQQAELRRQRDEEQRRQERERRQKEQEQTRREELRQKQEEEKEERKQQAAAAAEKHWREMERARQEQEQQQQWPGESYEFSQILPDTSEFAFTERAKSKSTSELDVHTDTQASNKFADGSWSRGDSQTKDQSVSYAEQERQRILDEMKKKTQLLTDSSWIRQRSASVNREPATLPGTMRRYPPL